eukprot:755029-Hanusia_phi.AAC.4
MEMTSIEGNLLEDVSSLESSGVKLFATEPGSVRLFRHSVPPLSKQANIVEKHLDFCIQRAASIEDLVPGVKSLCACLCQHGFEWKTFLDVALSRSFRINEWETKVRAKWNNLWKMLQQKMLFPGDNVSMEVGESYNIPKYLYQGPAILSRLQTDVHEKSDGGLMLCACSPRSHRDRHCQDQHAGATEYLVGSERIRPLAGGGLVRRFVAGARDRSNHPRPESREGLHCATSGSLACHVVHSVRVTQVAFWVSLKHFDCAGPCLLEQGNARSEDERARAMAEINDIARSKQTPVNGKVLESCWSQQDLKFLTGCVDGGRGLVSVAKSREQYAVEGAGGHVCHEENRVGGNGSPAVTDRSTGKESDVAVCRATGSE